MATLVKRLEYSISDHVKQLAELYLTDQITKKQFDERVLETAQVQQIAKKLKRENKKIYFCGVSKVKASGEEHYALFVEICEP